MRAVFVTYDGHKVDADLDEEIEKFFESKGFEVKKATMAENRGMRTLEFKKEVEK
jgi:hypothetical protein